MMRTFCQHGCQVLNDATNKKKWATPHKTIKGNLKNKTELGLALGQMLIKLANKATK
jgi:hypothetical protein